MRIITHDDGRCLTLRLVGELDHAAAQTVMPGIEDAVEEYLPRRCVLDLTGVSFMDSSGIAVILKTDRLLRQTGGALALSGVPGQVRRVLDVAGLTKIVPVLDDRKRSVNSVDAKELHEAGVSGAQRERGLCARGGGGLCRPARPDAC